MRKEEKVLKKSEYARNSPASGRNPGYDSENPGKMQ